MAARAAVSPARCAANAVDFREPRKPIAPALLCEITLPCGSVNEISVLLNVALIYALPCGTNFFSRRRVRCLGIFVSLLVFLQKGGPRRYVFKSGRAPVVGVPGAIHQVKFLVAGHSLPARNRLPAAAFCAGVGLCPLSSNGQAPPVTNAPKSLDIGESPDVQLGLTPQVTLDQQAGPVNGAPHPCEVFVGEISNACRIAHADVVHDLFGCGAPDAINGSQRDFESLVVWNIYAGDDGHGADFSCSSASPVAP